MLLIMVPRFFRDLPVGSANYRARARGRGRVWAAATVE